MRALNHRRRLRSLCNCHLRHSMLNPTTSSSHPGAVSCITSIQRPGPRLVRCLRRCPLAAHLDSTSTRRTTWATSSRLLGPLGYTPSISKPDFSNLRLSCCLPMVVAPSILRLMEPSGWPVTHRHWVAQTLFSRSTSRQASLLGWGVMRAGVRPGSDQIRFRASCTSWWIVDRCAQSTKSRAILALKSRA